MPDDTPLNMLPADALFTLALTGADEEQSWSAITQLHRVATEAVFTDAARLCRSSNPHDRRVGVDVLAQLGLPENTFHEQAMHVLFALLETEEAPEVLASIGSAGGHRHDERAIGPLLALQQHPVEDVRYGVVLGMLGHTDPRAITCLIALSTDQAVHVRDWATFGLGEQIDSDTPEIRAALHARLHDQDGDTVGEAMVGLARRKDAQFLAPLLAFLQAGNVGSLPLEAAAALTDPVLLPTLQQIQVQWSGKQEWPYQLLEEAIAACTPHATE
jgi:HEAT repeat protein